MDMETRTKNELVMAQVLNQLASTDHPQTSAQLIDAIEPERNNDIHRACGNLLKSGQIVIAGETKGARGSTARLYALAEPATPDPATTRLIAALEREIASPQTVTETERDLAATLDWPDALERPEQRAPRPTPAAHLLAGETADDDAEACLAPAPDKTAAALQRAAQAVLTTDPIIAALDRLGEPRYVEGRMHAQRLRALAASAPLGGQIDIQAWLMDLAGDLEGMAA